MSAFSFSPLIRPCDLFGRWVREHSFAAPHAFFGCPVPILSTYDTKFSSDHPYDHMWRVEAEEDAQAPSEWLSAVNKILGTRHKQGYFPRQVHSADVLTITAADVNEACVPPADAVVTQDPGVILGVQTADCCPVLFRGDGIVGAAHAGWRGAVAGVLSRTVTVMQGYTSSPLYAVIGPTIRVGAYEVDQAFCENVRAQSPFPCGAFFQRRWSRLFFDLPGYVAAQLRHLGVHVVDTGIDTFGTLFFSRRYALAQGQMNAEGHCIFGHNISVVSLPDPV